MKVNPAGVGPPAAPSLGVCWYPEQWDEAQWRTDAKNISAAGMRIVRLGEFAWSRLQPARKKWDAAWLVRALDILHSQNLQAVVGTPTATPPKWLLDEMPDAALVLANGETMAHGARRHFCHAHPGYRAECAKVVKKLAAAVGKHPAVVAWQTDNEYGCHNTALSYSPAAEANFRRWLRRRYKNIAALNAAWGCAFWSQTYANFSAINLPRPAPAEHNPALLLDFYRYTSESICAFNKLQVDILRRLSPRRAILHNMMGFTDDFCHFALSQSLDAAAWDSYPLGFLARHGAAETRRQYLKCGHPDIAAFHHDLYRACGRGRFWVMEQQPGAVNWGDYNPEPAPGVVRLWAWEAFAHGAEAVLFFRWRQARRGQEQMHSALRLPNDMPAAAQAEAKQTAAELQSVPPPAAAHPDTVAQVALLVDYASLWAGKIMPHGDFPPLQILLQYYSALRRCGAEVDIINTEADFSRYRLLVAPLLFFPPAIFIARLKTYLQKGGAVLFGARSGSKTDDFAIPADLPPGALGDILGLRVLGVDSLPPAPGDEELFDNDSAAPQITRWAETIAAAAARPVRPYKHLYANGNAFYFAARANAPLLQKIVSAVLQRVNVDTLPLPPHCRARRRGETLYLFNYGQTAAKIKPPNNKSKILLPPWKKQKTKQTKSGGVSIPPADITAVKL